MIVLLLTSIRIKYAKNKVRYNKNDIDPNTPVETMVGGDSEAVASVCLATMNSCVKVPWLPLYD